MDVNLIPDIIIAIDGFSSTGKSSFAKLIAADMHFLYLDSGALYRAVTLHAIENGLTDDTGKLCAELDSLDIHFAHTPEGSRTFIGKRNVENEIRTLKVSNMVSHISAIPQVRAFVDMKLHEFGSKRRIVMDGRDIGTTVFPDADIKIFMTAEDNVRAQRRYDEMVAKGQSPVFEDVLKNLKERDYIDSHRETSPLTQAADAIVLDNSHMTMEEQMTWIRELISTKYGI